MDKQIVVDFAKALGLAKIDAKSRKGYVIVRCPFATWTHEKGRDDNPSAAIRYGKKTFFTCFACDEHGDLFEVLLKLAYRTKGNAAAAERIKAAQSYLDENAKPTLAIGADEDEDDVDELIPFPEWYVSGFPTAYDHPYLQTRKGGPIPPAVAQRMDFRLDFKRNRLGVPIRSFDGVLMGFHGRTVVDAKPPYLAYTHLDHWNRPVWSGEHRIDVTKPVLMVESIFDEARAMQVYRNVCSPLSASLNEAKIKRMGSALKIVEMFDADKAGQVAAKKLKEFLPDSIILSPGQVPGFGDVGETPATLLYDHLKNILPLSPLLL